MLKQNYVFPSLIACQISLMVGAAQGYTAILLSQLENQESPFQLNRTEASWILSLGTIGRPLGVLIEGLIVDKCGRKMTMQIVAFLFIISWLFTASSDTLPFLYASRIFLSFTMGMVVCVGLYIVEITSPEDRGTFLSVITPLVNIGILVSYFLGYVFHWKSAAYVLATYSFVILFSLRYIPESHIWYMLRQRKAEARRVLQRLRKADQEVVDAELEEIRKKLISYHKYTGIRYLKNFVSPTAWKPFVIFTLFSLLQQPAGYNVIIQNAVTFFGHLGSADRAANHLAILFASISTVASLLLVVIVHKYDRLSLLFFSGIGMAVTMAVAATTLSLPATHGLSWLPVGCVFVYIFSCMLGMVDIPYMMIGEIFPNHLRGIMSAFISITIFFLTFLNLKIYPFMLEQLKITGVLWIFAVFSLLSVCFAKMFFPETRGKALTEVEEYFQKEEHAPKLKHVISQS